MAMTGQLGGAAQAVRGGRTASSKARAIEGKFSDEEIKSEKLLDSENWSIIL
jgi:hypothetical protein